MTGSFKVTKAQRLEFLRKRYRALRGPALRLVRGASKPKRPPEKKSRRLVRVDVFGVAFRDRRFLWLKERDKAPKKDLGKKNQRDESPFTKISKKIW